MEKPTIQPSPIRPFSPPIPDIHAPDEHFAAISPEIDHSSSTFEEEIQKVETTENPKKDNVQEVNPPKNMNKSEKPTPNRIVTKRLGPKHLSLNPQRHPNIEKQVFLYLDVVVD